MSRVQKPLSSALREMSKFSITVSHQASRNADVPGQTVEMCSKTLVKWLLHIRQISGEISGSVQNLTINLQSSISKTLDGIFHIAEGGLPAFILLKR